MSKSITIKNVPDSVWKKWGKARKIIMQNSKVKTVVPKLFEEMVDNFLADPDVKKYIN